MTPGRIVYSGTDAPTRPGTRSGSARGSVSGVCPEASRRPAGMRVAPASAGREPCERRAFPSHFAVTSLTLAGRSLGCPAFFPFHSAAAAYLPRRAERRRLLSDGGRRRRGRLKEVGRYIIDRLGAVLIAELQADLRRIEHDYHTLVQTGADLGGGEASSLLARRQKIREALGLDAPPVAETEEG